jgi:ABC-type dipeptide/oligopeptide/nickel transport system permease component
MLKYSLQRIGRSTITIVIIIAVVFSLLRLMPIEGYFENFDKLSEQQINNKLNELGLNDPLPEQLFRFFKDLLQGDLGISHKYRRNVAITEIIAPKVGVSAKFGLISMGVSLPLGMALGAMMARKKGGLWDKAGNIYIVIIQAVPNAVYFLLLQVYGSMMLNCGMLYRADQPMTMVMPIVSMALPSISSYAMWLRRYMVDETNKDYIKLARAKGVPNTTIWFRHVFRNSVVPMVNLIPGSILMTISGSIYTESLYSIPGMGGLLVDVIKRQDNSMVLALVVLFAAMSIIGLLLGDILMGIVDPRISFAKKEGAR